MRNNLRSVVIVLILATFCFTGESVFGQKQNRQHRSKRATATRRVPVWEYKITGAIGQEEINRLGAEGWELTAATAYPDNAALYFKRRKN